MSKKQSKNFWGVLGKLNTEDVSVEVEPALTAVSNKAEADNGTVLTTPEKNRLALCEDIIEKGLNTFIEVGQVLLEIKERKLYREAYNTFETYCAKRWGLSRPRAYQLIEATNVVNNLSTIVDKLPETESQARPLAKLSPKVQQEVWKQVLQESEASGRPITAKIVADKVEKSLHKPIKKKMSTIVDKSNLIKKIRKAIPDANLDVVIEVSGKWLIRTNLVETWKELRGNQDLEIDETFKDYITLKQAELLGIIRKA
jgi:hypothetical protein